MMEASCRKMKDKSAIQFFRNGEPETELTFDQLDKDACQMAHTFMEQGVQKGDRVVLFIDKSLVEIVAHLALQKIGAVSVPLNPGFKNTEMEYLVGDSNAALVLTQPDKEALMEEIDPTIKRLAVPTDTPYQSLDFFRSAPQSAVTADISPEDPAVIIYTSGTTGNPKGAILTQQNLAFDAQNIIKVWEITSSDILCHTLPLFHIHGLCFAFHTLLTAGGTTLMLDQFNKAATIDMLSGKKEGRTCTVFMAVPTIYSNMMDFIGDKVMDFSHLRLITSGSAPLLVKEFDRIKKIFGAEAVEREGMSETGMNFSNPIHGERVPGSIGIPMPGVSVRLVDPNSMKDVDVGEVGEIWLKSSGITPGYLNKPKETEETFHDGWFKTGDLGKVDEKGYYYITDRIKHIIISGGENVSAKEVETVINTSDQVMESSVVGLPDEKWGETIAAAVVPKKGETVTAEAIKTLCKEKLHPWKCPRQFIFVETLPKNTMGKVLNAEVKKLFS